MKLQTLGSVFLSLLLYSKAWAVYQNIPMDQLESYKKAAILAGIKSGLKNCNISGLLEYNTIQDYILTATAGQLDTKGSQPILIFSSQTKDKKYVATLISKSDYKLLVSIKVEDFIWSEVNTGYLKNPIIEKDFVLNAFAECN